MILLIIVLLLSFFILFSKLHKIDKIGSILTLILVWIMIFMLSFALSDKQRLTLAKKPGEVTYTYRQVDPNWVTGFGRMTWIKSYTQTYDIQKIVRIEMELIL